MSMSITIDTTQPYESTSYCTAEAPAPAPADPYETAAQLLNVTPLEQARLVWSTLHDIADETVATAATEVTRAVVVLGVTNVPVRDYVLAQIASYTEGREPLLLAMSTCTGSAPKHLQPHIAAATAMLAAGFDLGNDVVEVFLDRAGDQSLAQLVRNGLAMRAPASLYRHSMRQCLPGILRQLEELSQQ